MKKPILCYVTDRALLPPADDRLAELLGRIERAAHAGVDWIQLREKDLEARPLYELTRGALEATTAGKPDAPPRVLLNDRLDVAWAAHSSGVHLGENSLPIREVLRWRDSAGRGEFLIGQSCHALPEAAEAAAAGADYIFFGPVFTTPSKAAFGAPQGLEKFRQVCAAVSIPVLAIGGITAENARSCLEAGAAGIAAIRLFQEAPDLASLVERIRS